MLPAPTTLLLLMTSDAFVNIPNVKTLRDFGSLITSSPQCYRKKLGKVKEIINLRKVKAKTEFTIVLFSFLDEEFSLSLGLEIMQFFYQSKSRIKRFPGVF